MTDDRRPGVRAPQTVTGQGDHAASGSQQQARERVRIEAARLRVITDRKLGKVTPAWVDELAAKSS